MTREQLEWRAGWLGRLRLAVCVSALSLAAACAGYGGDTVDDPEGARVTTDGEHCALTLPQGWTWQPATWTGVSPLGTRMSFSEDLLGRPRYPDWTEIVGVARNEVSDPAAEITETDAELRIDYGADGGLSVLRRFDNTACQVTFSHAGNARAQELDIWEAIVESMEKSVPEE